MENLIYENGLIGGESIDKEIEKIESSDTVCVRFDATRKDILFLIGIIFAANKKIEILNKEDLNLLTETKSFDKMVNHWEERKEGPNIINNSNYNKIFLICPVRNITAEQKNLINNYVSDIEEKGYSIHNPNRDTNQIDSIGFRICKDNGTAVAESQSIHIFYDSNSRGTLFDLGMSYYFKKKLVIANKDSVLWNREDFGDNVILDWESKTKENNKLVMKNKI